MPKKTSTADQIWVRKMNRSIILDTIRTYNTLSRAGLADRTGLNPSTVSNIVTELLQEGFIKETDLLPSLNGRPGRLLTLSPSGGCAVGVEINVDFISVVLSDFTADIIWRQRIANPRSQSVEYTLELAGDLIQEAITTGMECNLKPLGIGIGLPGLVDLNNGELKFAPNLSWSNVPVRLILSERFDFPIYVENEANAGALGEYYFGAARGVENFIYLSAGYGMGGGIILDGKLFRGSTGYASEVGHMTVNPEGDQCACGKRGCWETLVGPLAVVRRVIKILREGAPSSILERGGGQWEQINFETVIQAAHAGDSVALHALWEVGKSLGIGVANLVNIFNPELVVLGGALNQASSILLPVIRQTVDQNALEPSCSSLHLAASAHGTDACVMGALALVFDDILREPILA